MENLTQFCCVCIETSLKLVSIKETDTYDVKLSEKLKLCESSQDWALHPYFICKTCKEDLNLAYNFIQKCQKSEQLRTKKIQELENQQKCETEEILTCDMCQKGFKRKRFLKLHITRVHGPKEKQGDTKSFKKIENVDIKNAGNNDLITDSKNDDDLFDSDNVSDLKPDYEDDLDKNFDQNDAAQPITKEAKPKKRLGFKRKKGPHTCEFCGKSFNRRQHWAAHVRANHTFEKIYKCEIENCGASFINSHSLLVHTRNHNNEKPYICSVCGKCFVCSGDLYHHSKIHENKREYLCTICDKGFNTTSILRTHKIVKHTDPKEWRYVCTECGKRFPINSALVTHMKRHSGEKHVPCMLCAKLFFNKAEVTKHLLSHSSEKLFKCTQCGKKSYKNREGLRKHLKVAHNIGNWKPPKKDKQYCCTICPKIFIANHKLQRHLLTHTGEKPFSCQYCEKKFIDNYAKKVHLRKEHNIDDADEKTYVLSSSLLTYQAL